MHDNITNTYMIKDTGSSMLSGYSETLYTELSTNYNINNDWRIIQTYCNIDVTVCNG